jgi:phosphopantothenoylcysteine decarboxylase/phosphopantothenate--cysteine ligase
MKKSSRRTRLVLGVTGSIACYKGVELARYFMKRGYDVRVVMTNSATKFVTPLTFESLTGNPVSVDFWSETQPGAIGHIELADWADVVVVAPATADSIAKIALGFAESSLLAVVLATKAPLVVAPAMNVNMYQHPQTQENIETLRSRGVHIVEPESGDLACGWKGRGRLASSYEIFACTERAVGPSDLLGKRVLISAGPTREAIDPVRYISNRSSGKMGIALAREAYRRGATVTFVQGPLACPNVLPSGVARVRVTTAQEMYDAVVGGVFTKNGQSQFDIVVMAAAVADFRPSVEVDAKIKKSTRPSVIELTPNRDIVQELGERRAGSGAPILVGFAVETGDADALVAEAQSKLERKNLDLVVGNLASDSFDKDTNQVWIVTKERPVIHLATAKKRGIARRVWDEVTRVAGA